MIDGTATLRGLTIGKDTVYRWSEWPSGLLSTPTVRADDFDVPLRHGIIAGDDFMGGREVAFEVMIIGQSVASVEAALAALSAAFAPSPVDLALDVRVAGNPAEYRLVGRPRGIEVAMSRSNIRISSGGRIDALCRFTATDPIRYAATESSVLISLTAAGAGLVYPIVYPVVYGAGGGTGSAVVTNAGTTPVDWSATLTGPLTNPLLRLSDGISNPYVKVLATIDTGSTVVLDSRAGSIMLDGTAPRPSWFGSGSSWWRLGPGSNTIQLAADSGTGTATLRWRSGWA